MAPWMRSIGSVAIAVWLWGCGSSSPNGPTTPAAPTPTVCPNPLSGNVILNQNETLRMSFRTTPLPTADYMFLELGSASSGSRLSWTLSTGTTVLGTQQTGSRASWRSAASLFTGTPPDFTAPPTIDFTAIAAGTFNGYADITLIDPTPRTIGLDSSVIVVSHAFDSSGFMPLARPSITFTLISTSCR